MVISWWPACGLPLPRCGVLPSETGEEIKTAWVSELPEVPHRSPTEVELLVASVETLSSGWQ